MTSSLRMRHSLAATLTCGVFMFCAGLLPAQTKSPVGAATGIPAAPTVPAPVLLQSPSQTTTTTLASSGKARTPEKSYSIRVRSSVVGIGKDAVRTTVQNGSQTGSQPAVQSTPGVSASLPDIPDSGGSFIEMLDKKAKWGTEQIKYAVPGTPIQVKLIGANIVSLIQLIPFENNRNNLDVVASGQVWIMLPDGTIQYRTTVSTLSVTLAERMFFFPLGYAADGSSPLVVEIIVDRLSK